MFNVHLNTLPLKEVLSLPQTLDWAALNPPQPNSLGIAQVALATAGIGAGLWWWIRNRPRPTQLQPSTATRPSFPAPQRSNTLGPVLLMIGALLISCITLILPASGVFWDVLPLARLVAFPWRLLGPALLWAALLGGAALFLFPRPLQLPLVALLLILIPLSVAPLLFPRPFSPTDEPTMASVALYELNDGAPATASADEYRPRWVQDSNPPHLLFPALLAGEEPDRLIRDSLPTGATGEPVLLAPLEEAYHLNLPEQTVVQIGRFYFPGWRAWLDGHPVAIQPAGPHGLIGVDVPAGVHELRLKFGDTPARKVGWGLMLTGLVGSVWILWCGRRPEPPTSGRKPVVADRMDHRALFVTFGVILLLSGAKILVIEPFTRSVPPDVSCGSAGHDEVAGPCAIHKWHRVNRV